MNDTIKSVLRYYLLCAIWLAVALGIGFAALEPVDIVLGGLGAGPILRGSVAIATGLVMASLVTWMLWASFPVRRSRPMAVEGKRSAAANLA